MSTSTSSPTTVIRENLLEFLRKRTKATWTADQDLFASGAVSSLFALELVLHLEKEFGVAVAAEELKLDNFRTVEAMTELVLRLRGAGGE